MKIKHGEEIIILGVKVEKANMPEMYRLVIFTVKDTDAEDTHFDTRQYNQIRWKDSADLREQLQRRIRATILE